MSSDQYFILLGRVIREAREQRGLSVRDLAAASGIAPARIAALEGGQLDPDFELLRALAKSMDIRWTVVIARAGELGDGRDAAERAEDG